jgi:serine/threonine-protein kinase
MTPPPAATQSISLTSPPTGGTQAQPSPTGSFAAETLAAIEHDLSIFIGPMARIAVRRAAPNCPDMGILYRELAKLINNESDRASFIAKSRERARGMPGASLTGSRTQGTSAPSLRDPPPAAFPPDVLSRIEAGLAEHIGPIARVLVRQHLSRTNSVIDLCRELALFIPDEQARANFLRSQRAG